MLNCISKEKITEQTEQNNGICFICERMDRYETGFQRESYPESERYRQIALLELHRDDLLDNVHSEERKISCLDYLLYQIRKTSA